MQNTKDYKHQKQFSQNKQLIFGSMEPCKMVWLDEWEWQMNEKYISNQSKKFKLSKILNSISLFPKQNTKTNFTISYFLPNQI